MGRCGVEGFPPDERSTYSGLNGRKSSGPNSRKPLPTPNLFSSSKVDSNSSAKPRWRLPPAILGCLASRVVHP